MSENESGKPTAEPETSVTIMPGTPKAEQPKANPDTVSMPKSAFDARLEQAKRSMLTELGVESVDVVKAALATAKAAEEAKKSDAQKLAEFEAKYASTAASVEALTKTVASYAQSQMSGLSESQKAAVISIAGNDPAKQLSTIDALKPTWVAAPVEAVQAPAIANSAPPRKSAPSDNGSPNVAPVDHVAVHADLVKTNPVVAARYALAHGIFSK